MSKGPTYGVVLLTELPIPNGGGFVQATPDREELISVAQISKRTVAAYELLTIHYLQQSEEIERLTAVIRRVIAGNWSLTDLQEAIGDLAESGS